MTRVAAFTHPERADVDARNIHRHTPLDLAISQGKKEVAALLKQMGAIELHAAY